MTFNEFRATGKTVNDLCDIKETGLDPDEGPRPGRAYACGLHIELDANPNMGWCLTIGNDSHYGQLAQLEEELYEFGVREELFVS